MKTFQELIDQFPNRTVTTYNPKTTNCYDTVVRTYNNLWGARSDTHMTRLGDEYIITGNRVNTYDWFRNFLTSDRHEGTVFPEGSFAYFMMQHNLCGFRSVINGQTVFVIKHWSNELPPEKPNPVFLDGFEAGPIRQPMDTVADVDLSSNPLKSNVVDDI